MDGCSKKGQNLDYVIFEWSINVTSSGHFSHWAKLLFLLLIEDVDLSLLDVLEPSFNIDAEDSDHFSHDDEEDGNNDTDADGKNIFFEARR